MAMPKALASAERRDKHTILKAVSGLSGRTTALLLVRALTAANLDFLDFAIQEALPVAVSVEIAQPHLLTHERG